MVFGACCAPASDGNPQEAEPSVTAVSDEPLSSPAEYHSHHFDSTKWKVVKPRPDDILIVSAVKSGTTWMQQIVSELVFLGKEKPASVGDLSPWVDLRVPPAEVLGPMLEAQVHRRFFKTHLPADVFAPFWNPSGKYVYVGRSGCDVFMSLMNHYEKGNDKWYGALNGSPGLVGPPLPRYEELMQEVGGVPQLFDMWLSVGWPAHPAEKDGYPFWSLFRNMRTWWEEAKKRPGQVLFVHYNNLLADLPGEIRRIAEFLGIEVGEAALLDMAKACTFDEMKGKADVVAPLNGALWKGGGNDFIFKGTNGRWKGVLSDEQCAAYQKKVKEELPPACAEWLETGKLE